MTAVCGVDFAVIGPQDRREGDLRNRHGTAGASSILRPRIVLSGLLALALIAPGCASAPKLDTYELTAPTPEGAGRHGRLQVLIAEPSALKALDGQNIVIRPAPGAIEYLKGAQWADRLPKVVQARLADTFEKSGRFGGVGRPGEGLAIDYQVIVDIRAFEVRVGQGDSAYVELFVRVLNDRNGVVKASRAFKASAPLSGAGNDAFVAALDAAFGAAAIDIVSWSASAM
jgi:cholesterol transport system auxiliary component